MSNTYILIHRKLNESHRLQMSSLNGWGSPAGEAYLKAEDGFIVDAYKMDMLKPVAVVIANDLEDLFTKTNHIHSNWTANDGVDFAVDDVRSTSVGDIVIDYDTGEAFICASFGWDDIEGSTIDELRIDAETFGDVNFDRELV